MFNEVRVFIHKGMWCTGYEPHDMPGAWAQVQYKLESTEGLSKPADGRYNGIKLGDNVLRIVYGGEWGGFGVVNQSYNEYKIEFDEEYHNQYKAGLERGYKGKRKCSSDYLSKKPWNWKCGYEHGREARLEYNKQKKTTEQA